ncbi:MAG TPA: hypothetical protein VHZ75_09270 [Solirubrobacteraceae bacterium]|jgi:hypothetical protein|nr:hypothetical protein [Solirubrobacteraceae bacterium]
MLDPNAVMPRHTLWLRMHDGVDILEQELGAQAPEGFAQLSGDQLRALAELLREARTRQKHELDEGVEGSLDIVPRLMRGPVRKILFG